MQFSALTWLSYEAFLLLLVLFAGGALYRAYRLSRRFFSPLRHLQGPKPSSFLWGSIKEIVKDDSIVDDWVIQYGGTFRLQMLLGNYRLSTIDPRAMSHILSHTEIYPKPEHLRHVLGAIVGQGVLVAEGDDHKRQRRIMNPSFSPGQIREVTPVFFDTASQLRDVLNSILSKSPEAEGAEINMYGWFGRGTLDVIGQAGFGYRFNALYDETNPLYCAFRDMMQAIGDSDLLGVLLNRFRFLRWLPLQHNRMMHQSKATTYRIGMELVRAKKEAVLQEMQSQHLEKSKIVGRDILSSLIRANMSADLSPAHRMSDEEVLAQISTFIFAGHETTAAGLSWTLLSLAQNPAIQAKLRAEVSLVSEESPSMDDLNALPYLDMVVKESMRYHCPVRGTVRIATRPDTIPLSRPIVDRYGRMQDHVTVQAGDSVGIDSLAMNHAKEFWGDDALVFRPERWEENVEGANAIPGIYAHQMTFIGGPRACIGYRFSVIETKALLFTMIRSFEFSPVEGKEIGMKDVIVMRPLVKGEEKAGFQLPLRVRRVQRTA
ncbi:cytochrome P450 [Calocera viscosa TUFC12733]|uniref:Cytochrome P450 n=1 Tax=Calocera viscosa (strain TUFC12733) TaxID=1330018 RepID=A0A167P034_CALVF|nr:cytochrome P450 [Calocera viscosa TUFC12733]